MLIELKFVVINTYCEHEIFIHNLAINYLEPTLLAKHLINNKTDFNEFLGNDHRSTLICHGL